MDDKLSGFPGQWTTDKLDHSLLPEHERGEFVGARSTIGLLKKIVSQVIVHGK